MSAARVAAHESFLLRTDICGAPEKQESVLHASTGPGVYEIVSSVPAVMSRSAMIQYLAAARTVAAAAAGVGC